MFYSIMLSLSGDTDGPVSHLEKNLGDYRGIKQALFGRDMSEGWRREVVWRASDGYNWADRETAERMKGWMRHDQ